MDINYSELQAEYERNEERLNDIRSHYLEAVYRDEMIAIVDRQREIEAIIFPPASDPDYEYEKYIEALEADFWRNYDSEVAEREEQQWFEENEEVG